MVKIQENYDLKFLKHLKSSQITTSSLMKFDFSLFPNFDAPITKFYFIFVAPKMRIGLSSKMYIKIYSKEQKFQVVKEKAAK